MGQKYTHIIQKATLTNSISDWVGVNESLMLSRGKFPSLMCIKSWFQFKKKRLIAHTQPAQWCCGGGSGQVIGWKTSLPCLLEGGTLKQTYLSDLNFLYRLLSRWKDMRKYGWSSFKDLIFRNPAVVDQVGLQTCLTRLSLEKLPPNSYTE